MALVKSRIDVLLPVLKRPDIRALTMIRDLILAGQDPIEWLEKYLQVDFSVAREIMQISLKGDRPDELVTLVNAVTEAYLEKSIQRDDSHRKMRLTHLKKILAQYDQTIEANKAALRKLGEAHGSTRPETIAAMQQYTAERLAGMQRLLTETEIQLQRAQTGLAVAQIRAKEAGPAVVSDLDVDRELAKHPVLADYLVEITRLKDMLGKSSGALPSYYRQKEAELKALEKRRDERRAEIRPEIVAELRERERQLAKQEVLAKEAEIAFLETYIASQQAALERIQQAAPASKKDTVQMEMLKAEITQTESTRDAIKKEVDSIEVELLAPPRINPQEQASAVRTQDRKRQLFATGVAALGSLALVMLGVSWWEFRARRLDSVEEVAQGLGIRVVGTLPELSNGSRAGLNGGLKGGDYQWQTLFTESVNAIRTLLLQAAQRDSLRIVMVTSAAGGEGKTSLATHLASSMAGAGRKTLLVDFDLRNPTAHRLLDQPLAPGLSEILRGEIDALAATRPTHIGGLWMISAGQCDGRTIQAMVQDGARHLFSQLGQHFDFVLVDSCPTLPVADSLLIGQHVDAVILSTLRDVSRLPMVYAAYQRLTTLGIRILGAVLNGASGDMHGSYFPYPYLDRRLKGSPLDPT
jgi:capsular exopolysaccharide synthesis family protein